MPLSSFLCVNNSKDDNGIFFGREAQIAFPIRALRFNTEKRTQRLRDHRALLHASHVGEGNNGIELNYNS